VFRIVATLAAAASLAACGYKGPLYLPRGNENDGRLPKVVAPLEFRASPDARITPALPDNPPSATAK